MPVVALGLLTLDAVQVVEELPGPNQKTVALSTTVDFGGPAANAAATAKILAGDATLYSVIGTGALADLARSLLRPSGVSLRPLEGPEADLPLSTVLVTRGTGERAIVSSHGLVAGTYGLPTSFDPPADGVLLLDGHYLAAAIEAAERFRACGLPVVLDGGSWKPGLERLLPLVDIAILSADYDGDAEGPRFTARSHGGGDIELWERGGARRTIPVPPVTVVDTLGAGDVLHGAFAHYAVGRPLTLDVIADCLGRASRVASYSCGYPGARGWTRNWRSAQ